MRKLGEIIRMDYKIIISGDAENDTNDAYIYYEDIQTGLGDRFLSELVEFYQKIKSHPTYFSFVSENKTIRSVALKIFPYKIVYEIDDDKVYVFAVYHFHKNPGELNKRL
jgi:mRNA-degrading endonuclease RelE of RelBE toxin-antitoxin system